MIAEQALREALVDLAHPGSWQGVARSLAWRLVATGERDPRTIERLSATAETLLAELIDDALWTVEQTATASVEAYLAERPGAVEAALAAARLDAEEESVRLLVAACERVLERMRAAYRAAA